MKCIAAIAWCLAVSASAFAGHPTPLPETTVDSILLEAEPAPTSKTTPRESMVTLYAAKAVASAKHMNASEDARIITHETYASSQVTLDYTLPNEQFSGRYRLQTAFAIGGVATQQFSFYAGPDAEHLQLRASFSQNNKTSWLMAWRPADAGMMLYPGDRVIRVQNEGHASGRKILDAFLLTPVYHLPADLTPETGRLRSSLQQDPAHPKERLYVLEANRAAPADVIYRGLQQAAPAAATAIQSVFGARAEDIASSIGIQHLPALVMMDDRYTVRGVLEQPADEAAVKQLLGAPTPVTAEKRGGSTLTIEPLKEGVAPAWALIGTWAGPAGLSLWGLEWESRIRPSISDPEIVTWFDTVEATRWRTVHPDTGGRVLIDAPGHDYTWSKGAAYACVYVRARTAQKVDLHLAHTGSEMAVWLDSQEITVSTDRSSKFTFNDAASLAQQTTVTDQGNPIEVKREAAQPPQVAALKLTPGWHRVLVKFITRQPKDESFSFAANWTDASGKPATFETSIAAPETELPAYTSLRDMFAQVHTNSAFNFVSPGDDVTLRVTIGRPATVDSQGKLSREGSLGKLFAEDPPRPVLPVAGRLRAVVASYDGKILSEFTSPATFPGEATFALGRFPQTGYYSVELTALTSDGRVIRQFPPDGLSVIGGTAAQFARREQKKMAVTYYFMANEYSTLYFPYMQRIGIYRNVGGNNGRALEMYRTAHEQGLELAVDFWNRTTDYSRQYIQETAPYVSLYKSFNEIDIRPDQRGTPEFWVEKSRREYEMVKQMDPNSVVLGGSLVRVGNDPWFRRCVELGLEETLDAWDVHCYPQQAPLLEGELANSPVESELGVINALAKMGRTTNKPFWIGETGARASHGHDARRWQADMVTKMTAWAQSRSNVPVIGFLIPWDYSREEGSLQGNDISTGHMPAEAAYYTASALIDGLGYKRIATAPNIQAAQFGPTILAWCLSDHATLEVPASTNKEYVLVDVVGRCQSVRASANGKITLKLSGSPQYLLPMADYRQLTAQGSGEHLTKNR